MRSFCVSIGLAASAFSAQAALTVNAIDVPTRIGRGETVSGLVSFTRASGSGPETITVVSPALIEVLAPLPAGCTLAGASGSIQTLTCSAVDPGPLGSSGTLSFNVRGLTLGGGNVTATNPGPPSSQASDSFSVVSGGDLSLAKTVSPSSTFINGQNPIFTLTPAIAGDAVPAGAVITITDQLPGSVSEFTLNTITAPGYSCNSAAAANASRTLVCTITGPLTSLGPITLQGKLTLAGAGGLRNNASIAPDGTNYIDTNPANNAPFVDFTVNNGADPRPTGSFPSSAVVSSPQILTINYVNDGPQSTTGGQVRAAIPAGFTIGPLPAGCVNSGPGTVNGITGTVITCTSGTVTSASSQSFALPLTVPATAQNGNFGVEIVTGPGGALPGGVTDADLTNNKILVPYSIVPPYADLSMAKTKTPGPLAAGAAIANTLTVTNNGVAPAVYSGAAGSTPLRVVDTMLNEEQYVSASAGWTCTDGGPNSGGAGQRRVVCLATAGGTLPVGGSLTFTLNTQVAASLPAPITLNNQACTGAQALIILGLTPANGPQPPDGNQVGGADCANASAIGTPVVSGQAQISITKESSRNGTTWFDPVAAAPTVLASDNSIFWRMTVTVPSAAANPLQRTIPTLLLSDSLPAILNVASPGPSIPGFVTPASTVTTTVLSGSAGGSCPATVGAGLSDMRCSFSNVAPGTVIQIVVRVDRPFEAGAFTNTAALSSPDAILTVAAGGGRLSDDAAVNVASRSDPAVTSKIVNPPNSATEPRVGQVVTYTIVARNLGPNFVSGPFTVSDTLDPTRFLVLSASAIGSGSSPPMNCSVVTATGVVNCATGAASTVSRYDFYTVTVAARIIKPTVLPVPTPNNFTNTARVSLDPAQNCEFLSTGPGSTSCNDPASRGNNTGSVTIDIKNPLIDVLQKKSAVRPNSQNNFGFGDTLRYRFREQNNGPSRAEGIVMTDRPNVPAGYTVTYTSVAAVNNVAAESGYALDTAKTAATVSCAQPGGPNTDVICNLAGGAANFLDPATEVNFELTFTLAGPPAVISVGNTARICADETSGYEISGSCVFTPAAAAGNNIAAVNDVILPKTDLSIAKARITASPVNINQPVQYALTVQNRGNDATTQMRITDVLPPNFEWLSTGPQAPTAVPGGFAGLSVSALTCTASPAALTVVGQQQTVSCVIDGAFPGNTAANNSVVVNLYARPKAGFFTGPYLSDRPNTATVSSGLDSSGGLLSLDVNPANDTSTAQTQVQAASLSGTVFEDRDRSAGNGGVPQAAAIEPRIAGVTVTLTGTDLYGNTVSRTATTDASGNYSFTDLAPANATGYSLTETQPSGFDNGPVAPPTSGPNAPVPAGSTYAAGGSNGNSSFSGIALAGGATGSNFNFPELKRVNLSGFVYIDSNANGVRDAATDLPISGATVRLFDSAAPTTPLATATTDSTGAYSFTNLDPLKTYFLEEPLPTTPAGLGNGPVNPGLINGVACASGCTAQPNTPVANTDRIIAIDLSSGTDGTLFNFGEIQLSFVSGLVWVDSNRNATLDASEPIRLGNVTLRLVQGADCASGTTVQTTTTAADGTYRFDNVRAYQNYLVCETQPAGYGTGSANGVANSNVATVTGLLPAGSPNNNFGEIPASIAGSVYQDTGGGVAANFDNGVRDAGEPGIAGVPVTLTGTDVAGNAVSLSTSTDASGNYSFNNLVAPNAAGYTVTQGALPPAAGSFLEGKNTAGSAGGSNAVRNTLASIALPAGVQATDYIFGKLPIANITGTVYIDRNLNNTLDPTPTDGRIPNVALRLVQGASCAAGTTLQNTTTDANGNYTFANVAVGGNYLICETQPAGYGNGAENPGGSATTPGPNVISITNLPGSGSAGNHFGERVGSLAGSVYVDYSPATPANTNNGVRDSGEAGIAGVTITLTGRDITGAAVSRTTTTDASGNYSFADLLQSDASGYSVAKGAIPAAAGTYNDGKNTAGSAGGSNSVTNTLSAVVLGGGVQATNYIFGELPIAPITGTVYIDRDRDGTLNAPDGRIPGVTIRLVLGNTCAGTVVATTTTDASGNYMFSGVSAGLTYTLCETQPGGYADGSTNPGGSGSTTVPNAIVLTNLPVAGSAGNNYGERVGSLAGSVYADFSPAAPANTNNGVRDAGEAGIAGVPVTLIGRDINGAAVNLTTTTDANGNYSFADLLQSDAAGYTVTEGVIPPAAGSFNDGKDTLGSVGGANTVKNSLSAVVLGGGVQATGYNFGELPNTTISGTVYIDRNRNGTLDAAPTDGRIPGVTLRLVQGADCTSGTTLQTVTTDASGNYSFSAVSVGANYLICEAQPTGYANGGENPGPSGSSTGPNVIQITNLPAGGSASNNFGERVGSLAGSVWLDANNDGTRQGAEAGIPGVTLTLTGTDAAGNAISRSTTTDASGNYAFADLLAAGPGGYTVTEQAAQPVVASVATLNGKTAAGSTGGSATAVTSTPSVISGIGLAAGADSTDNRFGEILPVSLSGTVFNDLNNNGVQNPPLDTGLAGVPLVITGIDDTGAAVTRNVTTAADGTYNVPNLRPGTYTVTEPTQPTGTVNGQTIPGSAGGAATPIATTPSAISGIVLTTPGVASTGNNFAEIPNNSALSGTVWLDLNNNGLIDGAEVGIAGITVELSGTDSAGRPVARTTTTDANGRYSFDSLAPGTYKLNEPTQPPGTLNGVTVAGSVGGSATAVATVPSAISTIALGAGVTSTANNFGEVPSSEISGRVYGDNNNNGLIDGNETGLPGITLVLTGTDDQGNPVSITVVTGPDGSYTFPNLRPGTYTVTEPTQPPGTLNGITTPGTAGGTATTPAVVPSAISAIVLAPGGKATGNNFGELANSPDLKVTKSLVEPKLTVGFTGTYKISVRNVGQSDSSGVYTVSDRLPAGLTLAATPSGTGWTCVGAVAASTFSCTSTTVIAAAATNPNVITATVNVAAAAANASPVNNAVLVDGGGEIDARRPTAAELDAFNNNAASLPLCPAVPTNNACRTPTPVQLAASISGTVWYDVGSAPRLIDGGDRRLPGWGVEIIDTATGAIVGRATTGADGTYKVPGLIPGVPLAVRFRDPASGVVFGYPVNGETALNSSGATCDTTAAANGKASSCVGTGNTPALTVVLAAGQDLPQQSMPVDPSGVVYDSGLRQPVPGSVVTLSPVGACAGWNPATGLVGATLGGYTINGSSVAMTVGGNGFYQFLFGPSAPASCTFGLTVTPPAGYTFVSKAIPPSAGPLVPSGGAGSVYPVQPQASPPVAAVGPATTYFLTFTTGSGGANIVHNHIPLDPFPPSAISLAKTGDKAVAEVGDSVRYSITVSVTAGAAPRQTTVVDHLPAGFTYIKGTAMVGDVSIADPTSTGPGGLGPTLAFNLGPMPLSNQLVLRYRVRVGVGAMQGDGINRAKGYACGAPTGCVDAALNPLPGTVPTNEAAYRVRVSGGVFATEACVVGKIFVDCNNNHIQDHEELGIPGVRLVMQDGTTLISDSEGKYSVCGVPPKSAVLKVDPLTLPRGSRLTTSSNRNLGDAGSLWLDLKNGELHRADFIEGSCSNTVLEQVKARRAQGEVRAPEPEKKGGPALRFDSKAHGLTPLTSPQQGTDGANQQAPKPRAPVPVPKGPADDETNVPTLNLPMNKPAPAGRDSGTAPDAGASHGAR